MTKDEWMRHHGFDSELMAKIDVIRNFTETKGTIVDIVENPTGECLRPPK